MKSNNFFLQFLFSCCSVFAFFNSTHAQIEIMYETEIFDCAPLGVTENASINCSFNGTLSYEIIGDPDELINIQAPVDVVDGNFSFLYLINAPAPSIVEVTWTIETSDDASGCAVAGTKISTMMSIDCQCSPVMKSFPINHESCYQCADGSGQFLASGMQAPITYEWSNGATTASIENLAPGTYNLTATGSNPEPCLAFGSLTIKPYECTSTQIQYSIAEVQCFSGCDGSINIQGLENEEEITSILWSDGSEELLREGLCAGFYSGTVTTADNCPYYIEVDIEEPQFLEVEAKEVIHANGPGTGAIILGASGGTPPYSYFISQDGASIEHDASENEINNLDPGCYDVTLIDTNGCEALQDSICVDNISAIKVIADSDFKIYPNPCSHYLTIDNDHTYEVLEINIFNLLGEKEDHKLEGSRIQVDHLTNGIYIMDIVTDQGHWIQQFVKSDDF